MSYIRLYIFFPEGGALHEQAALGAVLPHSRGAFRVLGPAGHLRDALQAATGADAVQLRFVDAPHRRQRGDVEDVSHAVLRRLGGALCVGHRAHLPGKRAALGQTDRQTGERKHQSEIGRRKRK